MRLSKAQIEEAAMGTETVTEEGDCLCLHRFTAEQENIYKKRWNHMGIRPTAGICLSFETDSPSLSIGVTVSRCLSRFFPVHEIFCGGRPAGCFGNPEPGVESRPGDYGGVFELGPGMKRVRIVFPWSVSSMIRYLDLEDGSVFRPVRPKSRTIFFGDSITMGFDAGIPSAAYMVRIAELLGTEGFNKAVGGEIFFPELAHCRESFEPDLIITAYGTNDWNSQERPAIRQNCRDFFAALHENYPRTPVYALTPIWRSDLREKRAAGAFEDVGKIIREETAPYENVTVFDGFDFVPHEERFFSDRRVHPNDDGFRFYTENLWERIKGAAHRA